MAGVKRDEATCIEVEAAGVGYRGLAVRQIQIVECASVTEAYACSRIPAGEVILIALLGSTTVRAERQRPALFVEQVAASRNKMCLAMQFAPN